MYAIQVVIMDFQLMSIGYQITLKSLFKAYHLFDNII